MAYTKADLNRDITALLEECPKGPGYEANKVREAKLTLAERKERDAEARAEAHQNRN